RLTHAPRRSFVKPSVKGSFGRLVRQMSKAPTLQTRSAFWRSEPWERHERRGGGPHGSGQLSLPLAVDQALLPVQPGEEGDPDPVCPATQAGARVRLWP